MNPGAKGAAIAAAAPRGAPAAVVRGGGQPRLAATFVYGLFAMPLAMAALPLYVHLPKFYGDTLGVDLALPPSLLADVIDRDGRARPAGAYFGLWTLATKLNLALAAGIALPLLAALGYVAGASEGPALPALAFVYAIVPCALKLVALVALRRFEVASARGSS